MRDRPRVRGRAAALAAVVAVVIGLGLVARMLPPGDRDPAAAPAVDSTGAITALPRPDPAAGSDPTGELDAGAESPSPAGGVSAPEELGATDWWSVLRVLDERRSAAFEELDSQALSGYAVRDSPAWTADGATIDVLAKRGVRPVGLGTRLLAIESIAELGDSDVSVADPAGEASAGSALAGAARAERPTVELTVVDLRSGYELRDAASGVLVDRVEPSGAARWRVRLVPVTGPVDGGSSTGTESPQEGEPGWRVLSVEPVEEAVAGGS